jgi:hypothetical protein
MDIGTGGCVAQDHSAKRSYRRHAIRRLRRPHINRFRYHSHFPHTLPQELIIYIHTRTDVEPYDDMLNRNVIYHQEEVLARVATNCSKRRAVPRDIANKLDEAMGQAKAGLQGRERRAREERTKARKVQRGKYARGGDSSIFFLLTLFFCSWTALIPDREAALKDFEDSVAAVSRLSQVKGKKPPNWETFRSGCSDLFVFFFFSPFLLARVFQNSQQEHNALSKWKTIYACSLGIHSASLISLISFLRYFRVVLPKEKLPLSVLFILLLLTSTTARRRRRLLCINHTHSILALLSPKSSLSLTCTHAHTHKHIPSPSDDVLCAKFVDLVL